MAWPRYSAGGSLNLARSNALSGVTCPGETPDNSHTSSGAAIGAHVKNLRFVVVSLVLAKHQLYIRLKALLRGAIILDRAEVDWFFGDKRIVTGKHDESQHCWFRGCGLCVLLLALRGSDSRRPRARRRSQESDRYRPCRGAAQ